MSDLTVVEDLLQAVARILLWCLGLSIAALLLWWLMIVLAGDWVYRIHAHFFDISRQQFAVLHYGGLMMGKISALGLFLFPYIGVRAALRARRQ